MPCVLAALIIQASFAKATEQGQRLLARCPLTNAARYKAGRIHALLKNGCALEFQLEQAEGLAGAKMSDLRESGAMAQDADVIMFIYRDDYYNKDSKETVVTELIISKQRNGPTGTCKLTFIEELTRFESLAAGYSNNF